MAAAVACRSRRMCRLVAGGDDLTPRDMHQEIKLAAGGVLPGYTPGRDVFRFFNPSVGTLDLSLPAAPRRDIPRPHDPSAAHATAATSGASTVSTASSGSTATAATTEVPA